MSTDGLVTCGTCRHWTPNQRNPEAGMGTCGLGDHWMSTKSPYGGGHAPYPAAPRWCDRHQTTKRR